MGLTDNSWKGLESQEELLEFNTEYCKARALGAFSSAEIWNIG